jgi:hypothetical protein
MYNAAIENQRALLKRLWRKACQADGIDPKDKFVDIELFSTGNQALKDYNFELRRYWNMQRDFFDP